MNRDDLITASYKSLMSKIEAKNPELAQHIKEKYQQEEEAFNKAADEAIPSKESKYWAKPSCNKCHGRGIKGTLHHFSGPKSKDTQPIFSQPLGCQCTHNNYKKWLKAFRVQYVQYVQDKAVKAKERTNESNETSQQIAERNRPEDVQEALPDSQTT